MLQSFTFYNYQTKNTQSVTAHDLNDAWRQLGIRLGSPFLRGTYQPYGAPVPIGPTGKNSEPKHEIDPPGSGEPIIFSQGA